MVKDRNSIYHNKGVVLVKERDSLLQMRLNLKLLLAVNLSNLNFIDKLYEELSHYREALVVVQFILNGVEGGNQRILSDGHKRCKSICRETSAQLYGEPPALEILFYGGSHLECRDSLKFW